MAYGAALAQLAAAAVIGALGATGAPGILAAWTHLRAAHVWLGLFGGLSLTIFATLVYLAPTVVGARLRATRWLVIGFVGMLLGPPVTAVGFTLDIRAVALAGMLLAVLGAIGQVGYVIDAAVRRGTFSSEHDWRRVAVGHLLAGPAWYAAAVATALGGLALGQPLAGWSLGALAVPVIGGWMLQELIGSWTHLAPAVTPGSPGLHARQRRWLAMWSRVRLIGHNVGVAIAWAGAASGLGPALLIGGGLVLGSTVVAVAALGMGLAARDRTPT